MTITFGIVLTPRSGVDWARAAAAAEQRGYRTLLLPDTRFTPSPFPALAAAAAVTTTIRLRPNVLAAPLRTPAATVRETAALQLLSDGRFELGIGSGRPDAAAEAQWLGASWGSPGQRRAQVVATIAAVRAEVNPAPPIMIAANGPRMLGTAAEFADRILLAAGPAATEAELADLVRTTREGTDRPLRFTHQVVGIGQRLPIWTATKLGRNADELRDGGAAGMLPAEPSAAAEILEHRREKYGIDEVIVPGELADDFAPILAHFTASSS
ncbi:N5,N10-methylene tetrahydromethanopterin reductase [Nocardia sputorum]|uniref:LLM class flavin-dependent oxidoreductase n=1 Tax=Nocardia sputorum TaxID=2984338 RepID=UPI00248F9066|nr:LLM class flavin-dependent oxidoreductase [Nocardia sputorum]BDT92858.1 N5,N10-methylene tetrahydromethanopterin reductase [Nocardia sputorum]